MTEQGKNSANSDNNISSEQENFPAPMLSANASDDAVCDQCHNAEKKNKTCQCKHIDLHKYDDIDHDDDDLASIVVRYGVMDMTGEFKYARLKAIPTVGSKVVIRTERGVELGTVLAPVSKGNKPEKPRNITEKKLEAFLAEEGPDFPFNRTGRVLRIANQQDIVDFRHLVDSSAEAAKYCRQQIDQLKLPMRLIKVEHLLGGERIVFYFTAENRVDFRELVRILASQYRTRIEMRQVGARDEAHLVADYERCGQRCCCKQYLKILKPVSMRMAKIQKATLDPSKISGRCGRLMCCLRYEDQAYEDLRRSLPRRNSWVKTEHLIGRVQDAQILTQLVKIWLPDDSYEVIHVDDIIKRDIAQPDDAQMKAEAIKIAAYKREAASQVPVYRQPEIVEPMISQQEIAELEAMEAAGETDQSQGEQDQNSRKRRGRRKRRRPGSSKNGARNNNRPNSNKPNNRPNGKNNSAEKSSEASNSNNNRNSNSKQTNTRNNRRRPSRNSNNNSSQGESNSNSRPAGNRNSNNSSGAKQGESKNNNRPRRRRRKPGPRKPGQNQNPQSGNSTNQ